MIDSSLPKLILSFILLASPEQQGVSITLSLTNPTTDNPSATNVSISMRNTSSKPQSLSRSGAFLDFSIRLTDVTSGLEVPLTKEGHDLRYGTGGGFHITSTQGFDLPPGQTFAELLELDRYFQIKAKRKYRLQVSRHFGSPPSKVVSNVLVIDAGA